MTLVACLVRGRRTALLAAVFAAMSVAGGCAGTAPAGTPSQSAGPSASPSPALTRGESAVVVTFRAADGSTWRTRLVEAADIAIARDLLAGRPGPLIPNGRIVRGSADANEGWNWHLDPADFEWADMTTEVCDGNPQSVEDGTLTSERYCPWTAAVVAVDDAP